jgi:hypothetical protein
MNFKKILPHLLIIVGFAVLAITYSNPALSGKKLIQHDAIEGAGAASEIIKFQKETGEWSWWTNSMFSGMPSFLIGNHYPYNVFAKIGQFINILPDGTMNLFLWCLVGAYLFFIALRADKWLAALGAIGYTFATLNILWIEAGHVSKVYALAFAPMMLAGIIWTFRGRYWLGSILFALGLGLETNANHPQINYYTAISIGILVLFEIYRAIKTQTTKNLLMAFLFLGVSGSLALATNGSRLWSLYQYSKESIRGKSDLTPKNDLKNTNGLDKDYAFSGSMGIAESFSLLIPKFAGGASGGELDEKSKTYETLLANGVPAENASQIVQQLPTYWGDQPIMTGSIYGGAILLFLFVLGLLVSDNPYKIPFATISFFFYILSLGSHFSAINDLMYAYFPMYNKFRDVKMILSVWQLFMVAVGVLGIKAIVEKNLTFNELKKPLAISLGLTAGLSLLFALMPSLFVDFVSSNDKALGDNLSQAFGNQQVANSVINSLRTDRASLLSADAWRSLVFILLSAVSIWLFSTKKIKGQVLMIVLAGLVLVDLFSVDKRYLNKDDFKPKTTSAAEIFQPTAADTEILKDKDPNFRVMNTTTSFTNDARDSYFHKSIGGYHGAKMKRMQELIENVMIKDNKLNMPVLNMLNTKYFIVQGQDGTPIAQQNPEAIGNAWFVGSTKIIKNADEELKAIENFNPRQVAFVDARFEEFLKNKTLNQDTTAIIRLTDYKPNHLTYDSDSKTEQVAVFSEVYYRGNEDWKSYIDGKEMPHFRADYVLRAMVLPAGKHKVEFKFEPKSIAIGYKIDLFASILLGLGMLAGIFFEWKKNK